MAIQIEMEQKIDASPERVFSVLTDVDGMSQWMHNLVRMELLTPGVTGVGARWGEVRKMFGREASEEFEVTRSEPPRALELFVDGRKGSSGRGEYRFRYALEPDGQGTRLHMHGEISGMGWFAEKIGRLFMGAFKKALAKDLEAMKAYAEKPR